jgi:deoxyribodipyrimidine photolyase-related protein
MKKIVLVFPHQLFEDNQLLKKINPADDEVWILEDFLFFRQYKFHKKKIMLHRATMKKYEEQLKQQGFTIRYIESENLPKRNSLYQYITQKSSSIEKIFCYEVHDFYLKKDLEKIEKDSGIEISFFASPMFINTIEQNRVFFSQQKKPFMKNFYEWQRKRLNILVDENAKPIGGKFSFDSENRKKLPKKIFIPQRDIIENTYIQEAREYVKNNFESNYGESDDFEYVIDSESARKAVHYFLENLLENFGPYEDAIAQNENTIFHSLLSPYLNIGLITPAYLVKESLAFYKKHPEVNFASLEGFIRQIIGWREFMMAMYEIHGVTMRNKDFWNHTKSLESYWWDGNSENLVIANTLTKTLKHAYNHHIERLMVLGNYMLLSEYQSDEVYEWFMTMYIDSYDWVMVPNVYGMSNFSDGGIFATKPYICASNYILKMSDYKRDGVWDKDFDEKFWNFLKKHKDFFSANIRFRMLLKRISE